MKFIKIQERLYAEWGTLTTYSFQSMGVFYLEKFKRSVSLFKLLSWTNWWCAIKLNRFENGDYSTESQWGQFQSGKGSTRSFPIARPCLTHAQKWSGNKFDYRKCACCMLYIQSIDMMVAGTALFKFIYFYVVLKECSVSGHFIA